MSSDPAAHVYVAVGGSRTLRVHVQADARLAFFAVATTAAGNVEGHRHDVTFLNKFYVAARLNDFAGDLMTQHESFGSSGSPAYHVLVATADISRNNFKDNPVVTRTVAQGEFGKIDALYFNHAGFDVRHSSVVCHDNVV